MILSRNQRLRLITKVPCRTTTKWS